jgi:NAD(P)-dependent dehydrogenase (short-subunit alcohol dehydrogenase family)
MGIEQKVAVITGASQGIGAALVKGYRDQNYRVVATARSMRPSTDDEILAVSGDIADRNTAERVISEGVARFGRIDTLVNNAGIFIAKPFTQYTEADYAAILGVNIAGFFHITQLAIAEMEKQGSGHIVQITTSLVDHAMAGVPCVLASLTKGGLSAATKSLVIEYAKRGIRVNVVAPGTIKTPMRPVEAYAQLPPCTRWAVWVRSPTSSTRSSTSKGLASLSAKSSMSTAARARAADVTIQVTGKPATQGIPSHHEHEWVMGTPRGSFTLDCGRLPSTSCSAASCQSTDMEGHLKVRRVCLQPRGLCSATASLAE